MHINKQQSESSPVCGAINEQRSDAGNAVLRQRPKLYGFSLVELMIVLAIISTLVVIALPSYQGYVNKARFAEVITATGMFKTDVDLCLKLNDGNSDICNNGQQGISAELKDSSQYVGSVTVVNGVITASSKGISTNGVYQFILLPTWNNENGMVTWKRSGDCGAAGLCTTDE